MTRRERVVARAEKLRPLLEATVKVCPEGCRHWRYADDDYLDEHPEAFDIWYLALCGCYSDIISLRKIANDPQFFSFVTSSGGGLAKFVRSVLRDGRNPWEAASHSQHLLLACRLYQWGRSIDAAIINGGPEGAQ